MSRSARSVGQTHTRLMHVGCRDIHVSESALGVRTMHLRASHTAFLDAIDVPTCVRRQSVVDTVLRGQRCLDAMLFSVCAWYCLLAHARALSECTDLCGSLPCVRVRVFRFEDRPRRHSTVWRCTTLCDTYSRDRCIVIRPEPRHGQRDVRSAHMQVGCCMFDCPRRE